MAFSQGNRMKKKLLSIIITLALTGLSNNLTAAGSVSAGKTKSASCAGCHGGKGNSVMPLFPKLAQQHSSYLNKQLVAFKDGTRKGPTMAPMTLALSEQDMADIAAYYATQNISKNSLPEPQVDEDEHETEAVDINELMEVGNNLYRNGNLETGVSACIACHGPDGEGNKPAAYPALNSQHADYLIKTLNDFKTGTRTKNTDNMMHMIAKNMTDDEIRAVAYHISMLK
jgi:cytochrome c553